MSTNHAVEAHGLVKRYGSTIALAGIDLEVPTGTVIAVLGPNGAGKTTAVRILTTLTDADEGQATVAGFDVRTRGTEVRRRIGLAAQDTTVDPLLTGRENLVMLGQLHQMRRADAAARATQLLHEFSLDDAADRMTSGYSVGMRRRLDLAATLVELGHLPVATRLIAEITGVKPKVDTVARSVTAATSQGVENPHPGGQGLHRRPDRRRRHEPAPADPRRGVPHPDRIDVRRRQRGGVTMSAITIQFGNPSTAITPDSPWSIAHPTALLDPLDHRDRRGVRATGGAHLPAVGRQVAERRRKPGALRIVKSASVA